MKKRVIIGIGFLLLFISCNTKYSLTELNKNFSTEQITDLNKITKFFKSQVCSDNKSNFKKCFEKIPFDKLQAEGKGVWSYINFKEQRNLYTQISKSTFNEIWMFGKVTYYPSKITGKSICSVYNGKYQKYLIDLGKKNPFIAKYAKRLIASGDFNSFDLQYWDILKNENYFDLNDPNIQLILAIHYLSLNDQIKRKEFLINQWNKENYKK